MDKYNFLLVGKKKTWLHVLLLAVTAALIYARLIHHDFVSYDDYMYLDSNIITGGVSVINDNWHPFTVLSLMLDSQIYGPNAAYGFHLTNILLHILNGVLVYAFFRKINKSSEMSLFIAMLFVIHPLQVETVAWVAERKGILGAFFFLSSLNLYAEFRATSSRNRYILSLLCFTLGLMAKAVIVALPVILLLMEWMYLRDQDSTITKRKLLIDLSPFFIIALAMGLLTIAIQNNSGVLSSTSILPVSTRILNALVSIKIYISQTIAPGQLSVFYPYLKSYPPNLLVIYFIGFVTISGSVIYAYARKSRANPLFGWLWFLLMLTPVLGFIQTGMHAHADRYMYLPIIGLLIILMEFVQFINEKTRFKPVILKVAGVAIILIYSGMSWVQAGVWKNTETLFLHANTVTQDNYIADASLALYYLDKGENDKAWGYYQRARKIEPKFATLYTGTTFELLKQKNYGAVVLVNRQMIEAGVRVGDGYRVIAQIMLNAGQVKYSIENFQKALEINRNDYDSLYGIGYAYYKLKNYDHALTYLQHLEDLQYNYPKLLHLIGDIYMAKGEKNLAMHYYSLSRQDSNSNPAQGKSNRH